MSDWWDTTDEKRRSPPAECLAQEVPDSLFARPGQLEPGAPSHGITDLFACGAVVTGRAVNGALSSTSQIDVTSVCWQVGEMGEVGRASATGASSSADTAAPARLDGTAREHPSYKRALKLLNDTFRKSNLAQRLAVLQSAAWLINLLERITAVI